MKRSSSLFVQGGAVVLLGCSAGGSHQATVGYTTGTGGHGGAASLETGGTGSIIVVGDASASRALTAHIEQNHVAVDIVTLACMGDCADVVAVAKGGLQPYAYTWEDGSRNPARHVCPSANTAYQVTVTDSGYKSGEFLRDPQTVRASVTATVLACPPPNHDAGAGGVPPVLDAGHAPLCATGDTVVGDPLGGTVTYFRNGADVPAGRYRISYVDGCMRYGPAVNWSIHNIGLGQWILVGGNAFLGLGTVPGVAGAGYASFDDCVLESRKLPPLDVDFAGGKLGVQCTDYPLSDNIGGIDGRNPEWCLTPL